MLFNPVDQEVLEELARIVGKNNVCVDRERLLAFSRDETPPERYQHLPEVIVTPSKAAEVAQILRYASRRRIPVTPRGAGSGLSGGAIPCHGGIALSCERMNRILEIDEINMVAVVEPGVVTNELNREVEKRGLFFAGYPMSLETCFIGGNIAENAGGGRAVKYGVTGRYILGLELVTPTGDILNLGGKRVKDVSGYDLKSLVIGSEGTLGIITRAVVKLLPLPTAKVDLLVLFREVKEAIEMVPRIMTELRVIPTSVEFMDEVAFTVSCRYINENLPYGEAGAMLLVEMDGTDLERVELEAEEVGERMLEGGAIEVYVADNYTTQERIWSVRRSIAEALMVESPHQSLEDIVVPVSAIPELIVHLRRLSDTYNISIPCYGHAGDGNLHATLVKNPHMSMEEWYRVQDAALDDLYHVVKELGGALSGEHGIGLKRCSFFERICDPAELALMRRIKRVFDPAGIMNPGKIFCA